MIVRQKALSGWALVATLQEKNLKKRRNPSIVQCNSRLYGAEPLSVNVTFIDPSGSSVVATGEVGETLLRVGQSAGLPLEGTCEGQMACSTCHVIVAPEWFDKLPLSSEEEEDMLDFAAGVRRTSRLSCQIELTQDMDGLRVSVPVESTDARGI